MQQKVALKYNQIPTVKASSVSYNTSKPVIIGYDTKKMWTEYQLINRFLYRSQNQHKSSFAFHHLKEVKRIGERIGKVEMWLKANFAENGERLFDFVGFLNTLRLLIEKNSEACRKTFYFYCHYLDQALFVPLAAVVVGSISTLHVELMNWHKYVRILYDSSMEKLKNQQGKEKVAEWCKSNNLEEKCQVIEPAKPLNTANITKPAVAPAKNKPSGEVVKKSYKKTKIAKSGNEIDDIFNNL